MSVETWDKVGYGLLGVFAAAAAQDPQFFPILMGLVFLALLAWDKVSSH